MLSQRLNSKESSQQSRVETQSVRDACSLDPKKRAEEDIDTILSFVKDVKFFVKLNVLQQRALCRTMTIEKYGPREFVFHMGDLGNKFYIILSGVVAVQVLGQGAACPHNIHQAGKCDCPDRATETLCRLDKGMGFGELALQSNAQRTATIQTTEATELLVMTKEDYDCHAGELHRTFIEHRVQFLRRCANVEAGLKQQQFTLADIKHMADCLSEQSLSGNTIICRQSDLADKVVFVRSGNLAVLRSVELDSLGFLDDPSRRKQETGLSSADLSPNGEVAEGQEIPIAASKSKAAGDWRKVQLLAKIGVSHAFEVTNNPEDSTKGGKSFEHFKDVQESRKQYMKFEHNRARQERFKHSQQRQAKVMARMHKSEEDARRKAQYSEQGGSQDAGSLGKASSGSFDKKAKTGAALPQIPQASRPRTGDSRPRTAGEKRTTILRVGTIGPFQYYGDEPILTNAPYNLTLMSDPLCDIYVLSVDIMRRLPKKLLTAFFNQENRYEVPTDQQLVDMMRQGDRWNSFKDNMCTSLAGKRKGTFQINGLPRSFREDKAGSDIAVRHRSNLQFVGLMPNDQLQSPSVVAGTGRLQGRDFEYFSEPSSQMLKRVHDLKDDPAVQRRILREGGQAALGDSALTFSSSKKAPADPISLRAGKFWSKLKLEQFELDLEEFDDVEWFDTEKKTTDDQEDADESHADRRPDRRKSFSANVHKRRTIAADISDAAMSRTTAVLPSIQESRASASPQKKSLAYVTQQATSTRTH
eukprot:gnl/MRDRNA2_/MRDRNA2_75170_c0_seq1.p1 gnl/MRDRNA2_/MRDRNA2_75170_c0~~gnl/MRDRNA2_/MRDRNA2_75170_c0_seq1.p1  ORF type:complete len:757 (+),score=138.66 gnl/MRDRNA2_/MRDRNA2_75170_c0_seq1:154-2424(+)